MREATMENGWTKRIEELEAEVAKLTVERDADRRREYGYSQQTVDARGFFLQEAV